MPVAQLAGCPKLRGAKKFVGMGGKIPDSGVIYSEIGL